MFRRVNFYSICFAFGLSVLLILAGSRYADNTYYRPSMESRGNVRTFLKVEDGEETYMPQVLSADPYETVSDIEKLFEVVRTQIKAVTTKYNFTYSGVRNLEDLLMESGGKPLKSIIVSTWRSGTTFLGEVLNAIPGTFYHYEPLLKFGIVQIRGPPESNDALSTIKNMLKCDFYGMDSYFNYGKTHMHQFSHNSRLWDHCKYNRELCYDADFTSRFCRLFPFQTMKVVRLRLRLLQDILDDIELNVKVLLLIRDPRGVMQSRQHRSFCPPSADCWHPELLCADMINDYVAASRLLTQHPDKLMVLRYEDLALNPNVTTHRILEFLRLSATTSVDEYLRAHTKNEVGGVSSTYRVTSNVPFKWKNELEFAYVDEVQNACKEAMDLWGYRMAHNATHMASKEFIPITNYTVIQ